MMAGTVIQITNLSSSVTEKQMRDLFGTFGRVDELKLYPTNNTAGSTTPRVGYVKYGERDSCMVAQHLTNTIFLDKALIVIPVPVDYLPDEATAMAAAGLDTSAPPQPKVEPTPVVPVVPAVVATPTVAPATGVQSLMTLNLNSIQPVAGMNPIMQCMSPTPVPNQLVTGAQARAALNQSLWQAIAALAPPVSDPPLPGSVPPPPVLGGNVDPSKIEEIRRTVYVGNLNTQIAGEALVPFFEAKCGEVLYVRMAGDETQPTRFVFVEFSQPEAVNLALQFNGAMFGDRPLKVNHSKNAVVKPQVKPQEVAQREVDAAMEQVRKAQQAIMKQIQPEDEPVKKSRSRSPSPHQQRSRSRRSHTRSRSPSRERDRDRDRDRDRYRRRDHRDRRRDRDDRRHSRSPRRRRRSRSRSRERRRSRSRDRDRRRSRRSRSRSYERRGRSYSSSPSPERRSSRKHKRRDRSRDRSHERSRDRHHRHGSTDAPPPPPPTAADDMYCSD